MPLVQKSFKRDRLMDINSGSSQLMDFYIPNYILLPKSDIEEISHVPRCPVLVFINSKSGGQLGGELLKTYKTLLNKNQVFDLGEEAPDKVLHKIYVSLEKLKLSGDKIATQVCNRLKLVVAGGDGTAGWLLGVVSDLKLSQPPPIATVPLGTGNNLPFSFGWGKRNPGTDYQSVKSFLDQVLHAKDIKIDRGLGLQWSDPCSALEVAVGKGCKSLIQYNIRYGRELWFSTSGSSVLIKMTRRKYTNKCNTGCTT